MNTPKIVKTTFVDKSKDEVIKISRSEALELLEKVAHLIIPELNSLIMYNNTYDEWDNSEVSKQDILNLRAYIINKKYN